MPIQPNLIPAEGSIEGLYDRLAEVSRRLAVAEANRGYIRQITGIAGMLPAGSITATHLSAGSVTAASIAAGSITSEMITSGAILTGHLAAGAVTAITIAAGTITADRIAANTLTAAQIQAGSLTATTIGAGAITTEKLAAGAVTSDKITVTTLSAITTSMGNITAGTITGATIQTATTGSRVVISSTGLTGYALNGVTKVFEINVGSGVASFTGVANIDAASVIPGGTITTNTLPGDRIVSNSIQTLQLAAGSVVANTIGAGAVTAGKLSVVWGGANMLLDSGFAKSPYVDWTTLGATAARVTGHQRLGSPGIYALRLTTTSAGDIYATQVVNGLIPGNSYMASAYFKAGATPRTCFMIVNWYTAGGSYLTQTIVGNVSSTTTGYTRVSGVMVAPANTGYGHLYCYIAGAANGEVHYIADAQFEPGDILTAYSRMPGEILPGEVGSTQITPDAVTTNHILAGTIQGGDIAGTTITGTNISGSTITADKLNVTTLSAITANMGTLTAGTITGATVQTATSGSRVVLDSSGFRQFIGASGTPAIHFKTDGTDTNKFTGEIVARGIALESENATDYYRTIRWSNTGSISTAEITSTNVFSTNSLFIDAFTKTGKTASMVEIRAYNVAFSQLGTLRVVSLETADTYYGIGRVEAYNTNFVQSGTGTNWSLLRRVRVGTFSSENAPSFGIGVDYASNSTGFTYGLIVRPTAYGAHVEGTTWDFYAAGAGGNYGPFTGAHTCIRRVEHVLIPGMIVSSTGRVVKREGALGEPVISTAFVEIEPATGANAKRVYGVYVRDEDPAINDEREFTPTDEERTVVVNGVGEGLVFVCDSNGDIQNGDLITVSATVPGMGAKQSNDVLRSSTVAKATESVDFSALPVSFMDSKGRPVKAKLVSCTYHCS